MTAAETLPDSDRVSVAASVRAHYAAAGLSASGLAREIGMSQSKMSRRTTAVEPFDIDELGQIASVLGVSLVELISGTNLPTRPRFGAGASRRALYLVEEASDRRSLVPDALGSATVGRADASVAQWIEHQFPVLAVTRSSRVGGANITPIGANPRPVVERDTPAPVTHLPSRANRDGGAA